MSLDRVRGQAFGALVEQYSPRRFVPARRALTQFLVLLLLLTIGPQSGDCLSITIDGVTLTPGPGADFINLQGTFGAPQPGLLEGLRIEPSAPGVTPLLFVRDTPTSKALGMTDFSLAGPRPSNPAFYPFNSHLITVEHTFSPFAVNVLGSAFVGMGGSYGNEGNRFVIGGELRTAGFLNANQINGLVVNGAFTPPVFIPNGSELVYHPADDIRFRGADLPNHSCDNIIGAPPQFSCAVSELMFLPAGTPLRFQGQINLTFVDPDRFSFPGSIDSSVSVVPEPTTLLLFGTTAAGLGLARWRQRRRNPHP